MRVTQRGIRDQWLEDIQRRLDTMDQMNRQIGSGVRVNKPADDPSGASRIVRIEEVVARNEQYLKNIDGALSVQRATESALDQMNQLLVVAKSLAVEGANTASVAVGGSFAALADEVSGIKTGILQIALSKHEGKYLFSGTSDETAPFGEDGGTYQGDSNFLRVNMGNGQTVAVNLPGDRAFRETQVRGSQPLPTTLDLSKPLTFQIADGIAAPVTVTVPDPGRTGPPLADAVPPSQVAADLNTQFRSAGLNLSAGIEADGSLSISIADTQQGGEITIQEGTGDLRATLGISAGTKNVFGLLDDLEAALRSQDSAAVSSLLNRLDRALDDLVGQRGQLGARGRNLEFAQDRLQTSNVTHETLRENIEGVDLPKAVTRLSAEEQAYQTALAAGARIFNVSILDFLR
jgi:flagellar hook-associated protein 3 FlgL